MNNHRLMDTVKITFEVSCTPEVIKQLHSIIEDKGHTPFDLINLFPSYLRTAQVFVKEIYGLDHVEGHSTHGIMLMGTQPIEKSQPIGNKPTEPTEFNFLMVGSDRFQNRYGYSREKIIKEFPNTPENFIKFEDVRNGNFTGDLDAHIYETKELVSDFCIANRQDLHRFLEDTVVYIADPKGIGSVYLLNPETYHKNITSKYEK